MNLKGVGSLMKESVNAGIKSFSSKKDNSLISNPRKKRMLRSALALKRVKESGNCGE